MGSARSTRWLLALPVSIGLVAGCSGTPEDATPPATTTVRSWCDVVPAFGEALLSTAWEVNGTTMDEHRVADVLEPTIREMAAAAPADLRDEFEVMLDANDRVKAGLVSSDAVALETPVMIASGRIGWAEFELCSKYGSGTTLMFREGCIPVEPPHGNDCMREPTGTSFDAPHGSVPSAPGSDRPGTTAPVS